MPDQLRDLSDQRDRANASRSQIEPDRLILPPRNQTTRRVCVACQFVPSRRVHWVCSMCGGRLVEVTS